MNGSAHSIMSTSFASFQAPLCQGIAHPAVVAHGLLQILRYAVTANGALQLVQVELLQGRGLLQRLYQVCHIGLMVPADN